MDTPSIAVWFVIPYVPPVTSELAAHIILVKFERRLSGTTWTRPCYGQTI